jgi:hypothetical protein
LKSICGNKWEIALHDFLQDDAAIGLHSHNHDEIMELSNEEYEKIIF